MYIGILYCAQVEGPEGEIVGARAWGFACAPRVESCSSIPQALSTQLKPKLARLSAGCNCERIPFVNCLIASYCCFCVREYERDLEALGRISGDYNSDAFFFFGGSDMSKLSRHPRKLLLCIMYF